MSDLTQSALQSILALSPDDSWKFLRDRIAEIYLSSEPAAPTANKARQLEQPIEGLDLLLSSSAWDLWDDFQTSNPSMATKLQEFWAAQQQGAAILILDSLSLRELPTLRDAAAGAGLKVASTGMAATTIPPETTAFARALGFPTRSALDNNGAKSQRFPGAFTMAGALPWVDCATLVPSEPRVIFWHHWPDNRLHDLDSPGYGFDHFYLDVCQHLQSPDFWTFVRRLATGRRLIITSDHGYAVTGGFHSVEPDQKEYLRHHFGAQRFKQGRVGDKDWLPPLTLVLPFEGGDVTVVSGRRKWQVQGGFPLLAHGGLTLMEVFVPWLEIEAISN